MSFPFLSWLHDFFGQHKLNPHKVAGAMATSKVTIDSLGAIEHWDWLPQFDDATTKAVAALNNWKTGDSSTEVVEALQAVQSVLGSVKGLNEKDQAVIAICAGAVESGVALFS